MISYEVAPNYWSTWFRKFGDITSDSVITATRQIGDDFDVKPSEAEEELQNTPGSIKMRSTVIFNVMHLC